MTGPVPTRGGLDGALDGAASWYAGWLGQTAGEALGGAAEVADKANPVPELLEAAMKGTIIFCALALGGALIVIGTWRVVS